MFIYVATVNTYRSKEFNVDGTRPLLNSTLVQLLESYIIRPIYQITLVLLLTPHQLISTLVELYMSDALHEGCSTSVH